MQLFKLIHFNNHVKNYNYTNKLKLICTVFQNIIVTVVCVIQAELQGGVLFWLLRWGEQTAELRVWVGLSYCDGGWNTLSVLKKGLLASAGLNDVYEQERKGMGGPLTISSPLYVGGVPPGVVHPALNKHSLLHGKTLTGLFVYMCVCADITASTLLG